MAGYGRILFTAGSAANSWSLLCNRSGLKNLPRYMSLRAKTMEKLGFPVKPKKPLAPYIRFVENHRKELNEEEPNLKQSEKLGKLAKKWADAHASEKEALRKAYDLDMVAYSKQLMIYEESITPEQKILLQQEMAKEKAKLEKLQLKKKCDDLGKPRRPPTGFLQYVQENKYTKNKDVKPTEWVKSLAEKWREMSEEEKSKYKLESHRLMVQYKLDMRAWEETMVRHGHIDVVRNRGLIDIKCNTPNAE